MYVFGLFNMKVMVEMWKRQKLWFGLCNTHSDAYLVFLSWTPGALTKSLLGTHPATGPHMAWFQVCVHFWCDSEQLPVTRGSDLQTGRRGGRGLWVFWDTGGRVSSTPSPASWSQSAEEWQLWFLLGFFTGCWFYVSAQFPGIRESLWVSPKWFMGFFVLKRLG